jgi:hypothetical protein
MCSDFYPYLELSYEEFFNHQAESKAKILDFFSLPDEPMLFHEMKKISSNNIRREIANHGEIRQWLKGSQYEFFLEDFKPSL